MAHFNAGDSHRTPGRGGFAIKVAMAKLTATVVQYTIMYVSACNWFLLVHKRLTTSNKYGNNA